MKIKAKIHCKLFLFIENWINNCAQEKKNIADKFKNFSATISADVNNIAGWDQGFSFKVYGGINCFIVIQKKGVFIYHSMFFGYRLRFWNRFVAIGIRNPIFHDFFLISYRKRQWRTRGESGVLGWERGKPSEEYIVKKKLPKNLKSLWNRKNIGNYFLGNMIFPLYSSDFL